MQTDNLQRGLSRSCGCLQADVTADRNRANKLPDAEARMTCYRVWAGMHARCYNPKIKSYPYYGGRGIAVCERWHDFENFYADMPPRPAGGTLDRLDNDKGYEPGNVRWESRQTQRWNRRDVQFLAFRGESLPAAEWARRLNISFTMIYQRLKKGWSVERALTQSPQHHQRKAQ